MCLSAYVLLILGFQRLLHHNPPTAEAAQMISATLHDYNSNIFVASTEHDSKPDKMKLL